MVWAAATFGAWVSFPFSFEDSVAFLELCERIQWIGCFVDSFLFPVPLISYHCYKLWDDGAFVLQAASMAFRGVLRSCFPGCPGFWGGMPWHSKQEHFHTELHGNPDFFFEKVWFWVSTHGILHSGRCPSLRQRKHECSWQRSVTASHEGRFLKPEELS